MTLLQLFQAFHREAKQPGSAPTTVVGATGRNADIVQWLIEAYNDIQRDVDGRWKWLRRAFYVDTVADTQSYEYGDCTDTVAAAAIARFRSWDLDEEDPPYIYLSSAGAVTERELAIYDWIDFRSQYVRGVQTSAAPGAISVDHTDKLYLGSPPDAVYRLSGYYWRGNQTLADDGDEPEMPDDFHMMIVYRAMVKYAYNIIAQEILARATADGTGLYDALVQNQWYGRQRLRLPGPIA